MVERREMALDTVEATRYVTALREGGSMPGLVEASDEGLYVVKFRGAGQGLQALVAEVLVGELIRAAGLPVPILVTVEVDARLGTAEPDPEIQELLGASVGENLGVDFLPGALPYAAAGVWQPSPELAAEIVWLDALTTNVDRTVRNPNLLRWHDRLWLIDHGAALYLAHGGLADPVALARRPFPLIADHVLLPRAGSVLEAGERLRARLRGAGGVGGTGGDGDTAAIVDAAALVPAPWYEAGDPPQAYVAYLSERLTWGGFAQEAEDARLSRA
jgi:hypothetical protein